MLRLSPTQIGLNTRDLVWHADRRRSRQSRRANGHVPGAAYSSTKAPASTPNHHLTKLAYRFPHPPSTTGDAFRRPGEALISEEAVPQDSRLFWDGILANAQTRSAGQRAFLRQPFCDSLVNTGGGGESFEGHLDSNHPLSMGFESENEDDVDPDNSEACPSSESVNSQDAVERKSLDQQSQRSLAQSAHQQQAPSRRRLSFRNLYQRARQGSSKDRSSRDHHAPIQNDLDGSSDQTPRHRIHRTLPSGPKPEPSVKPDPRRSRRSRRTDPSTFEVDINVENATQVPKPSLPISEPDDHFSPPSAMPRSLEMVIRRTSGLPRSPLHIAQAAASRSSSPEKRARSPTGSTDAANPLDSSFLARPPRRRRKYRPRSESYSFVASEASQPAPAPTLPPNDSDSSSDSDLPPHRLKTLQTTPSTDSGSSPPDQPPSPPPNYPAPPPPPRLSPHPTPRTVTFNLPLPASPSPIPSLSSPLAASTPPTRPRAPPPAPRPRAPPPTPRSPPPPSSSPDTPTPGPSTPRRSLRVYNDSRPPASQPQTPRHLRRHGVVGGSFTAPSGVGGRGYDGGFGMGGRRDGVGVPGGTPVLVRRGRGWGWGNEQENWGGDVGGGEGAGGRVRGGDGEVSG